MEKSRKYELSFSNILCCLAVIFIHINSEAVTSLRHDSVQFAAVYILWQVASFAVYGFVFLSGIKQFLSVGKHGFNAVSFYKKRFTAILVPYILWVLAYHVYDCLAVGEVFSLKNLFCYMYTGDYSGHFYFVVMILQFYLLMPIFVCLFKKIHPAFAMIFSFAVMLVFGQNYVSCVNVFFPKYTFAFSDRIFTTYLFWWTAGAYVGINYENAVNIFKNNSKYIFVFFAFCTVFSLSLAYASTVFKRYLTCVEPAMMMYRISGVAALFAFSLTKTNHVMKNYAARLFDASSYIVYLSHCLALKAAMLFADNHGIWRTGQRYALKIAAAFVCVFVCMLYTHIKIKIKNKRNI